MAVAPATFAHGDHQIEIAIHLDVRVPGRYAVVSWERPGGGTSSHVSERPVFVLQQERHTAGTAQREIGSEVMIPIERHDRVAYRRNISRGFSHRDRPRAGHAVESSNAGGIGADERRCSFDVQGECGRDRHLTARRTNRFLGKRQLGVRH